MHLAVVLADFEISSLASIGGTVLLNAPWGLVTSHPKSSARISSTTISTCFLLGCLYVTSRVKFQSRIKIDGLNFGEFMIIRQIHQCFLPPKSPSIWYKVVQRDQSLQSKIIPAVSHIITIY